MKLHWKTSLCMTMLSLFVFILSAAAAPNVSKPILIEGALGIETSTLVDGHQDASQQQIGGWTYTTGTLDGYPVVVCLTGEGGARAAAATAVGIERFHPYAVINQGTSGGNDPALHVYDIVLGRKSFDSSAWRSHPSEEGEGVDYKDIELRGTYDPTAGLRDPNSQIYYYADQELLAAAHKAQTEYTRGSVVEGCINTSNSWNDQIDRILWLYHAYGASCEEMETNAAAQICQEYHIPFVGIRIISNAALHHERYCPDTGTACQEYVMRVVRCYVSDQKTPVRELLPHRRRI